MSTKTRSMSRCLAAGGLAAVATFGVVACGGSDEQAAAPAATESTADAAPADGAAPVKDQSAIRECLEGEDFEVNAGSTSDDLAETFQISSEFNLVAPTGGYGSVIVYETTEAADDQLRIKEETSSAPGGVGKVGTAVYDWWGDEAEAQIVEGCLA